VPFSNQKGTVTSFDLIGAEAFRFRRRWFTFKYGQALSLVQVGSGKMIEMLDLFGRGPIVFSDRPERVAFVDHMDNAAAGFGFGDLGGLISIAALRYFE